MMNYIIIFALCAVVVLGICCVIGPAVQAGNTGKAVGNEQDVVENVKESIENTVEAIENAPTLDELRDAGSEAIGLLDELGD